MNSHALCEQYPELIKYINLCDYSLIEILLILVGTIFWNVVYVIIIRNGFKHKFIEMPVPAAASNLAWEFVWGFLFVTDLGLVFVWGLRIWFFLDLFIFWIVLKYGAKQLSIPLLIKHFKPIEILSVIAWVFAFYYFIKEGYDTSMGATSAYIITVIMASLYFIFYMSSGKNSDNYSFTAAWCKGLGNLLMSIFVFLHYPEMMFLKLLTIIVFIFNIIYIVSVKRKWAV